jgi:hypothetical protein
MRALLQRIYWGLSQDEKHHPGHERGHAVLLSNIQSFFFYSSSSLAYIPFCGVDFVLIKSFFIMYHVLFFFFVIFGKGNCFGAKDG